MMNRALRKSFERAFPEVNTRELEVCVNEADTFAIAREDDKWEKYTYDRSTGKWITRVTSEKPMFPCTLHIYQVNLFGPPRFAW